MTSVSALDCAAPSGSASTAPGKAAIVNQNDANGTINLGDFKSHAKGYLIKDTGALSNSLPSPNRSIASTPSSPPSISWATALRTSSA